jgi:Fe-S-cluster-containing dehydrogenase component
MAACPYDARTIHPEGFADKCSFCVHRVEKDQGPACVSVCPTKALVFGDINDPDSEISALLRARRHQTLKPETGLGPNIFYLG